MDVDQKIRERAFEIWQSEGCPDGRADHHWAQAEAEISASENPGDPQTDTKSKVLRMTGKVSKRSRTT
jgi:Protein of unknown function (DUF2934)